MMMMMMMIMMMYLQQSKYLVQGGELVNYYDSLQAHRIEGIDHWSLERS